VEADFKLRQRVPHQIGAFVAGLLHKRILLRYVQSAFGVFENNAFKVHLVLYIEILYKLTGCLGSAMFWNEISMKSDKLR